MESYAQFLERINSFEVSDFYLPKEGFEVNPSMKKKVDENNRFGEFYGDTVVFELTEDVKSRVGELSETLHRQCGECLSERLLEETLHVTLHDMCSGNGLSEISEEIFRNEIKLSKLAESEAFERTEIVFVTNNIINMVNTSVVLALKPKSEEDYAKLISLYGKVDCVKALPYPLTPHITLAYFSRSSFDSESAERLRRTVKLLNEKPFEISVGSEELFYEKFTDMNSYYRIFPLVKNKSRRRIIRKTYDD